MMKRWIAFILTISLCMTLIACSNQPTTQPSSIDSESSSAAPVVSSGTEDNNQEIDDNTPAPTEEPPESSSTETASVETTTPTTEKKETVDTPSESAQPTAPPKETESTTPKNKTETTESVHPEKQPEVTETTPPAEETQTEPEPTSPPSTYEIEQLVAKYINQYRAAQGSSQTTVLQGLSEVARYRAKQLVSNFSHDSTPDACTVLKYGEFIDMTLYGGDESDSYYRGYNREAIGMGDWFGTADQIAERIASGFKNSSGHWGYVGDSQYSYMAVGVYFNEANSKWYCCICMSSKNYGD